MGTVGFDFAPASCRGSEVSDLMLPGAERRQARAEHVTAGSPSICIGVPEGRKLAWMLCLWHSGGRQRSSSTYVLGYHLARLRRWALFPVLGMRCSRGAALERSCLGISSSPLSSLQCFMWWCIMPGMSGICCSPLPIRRMISSYCSGGSTRMKVIMPCMNPLHPARRP